MNMMDSKVPRNTAGLLNIIIVLGMLLICSRAMQYYAGFLMCAQMLMHGIAHGLHMGAVWTL